MCLGGDVFTIVVGWTNNVWPDATTVIVAAPPEVSSWPAVAIVADEFIGFSATLKVAISIEYNHELPFPLSTFKWKYKKLNIRVSAEYCKLDSQKIRLLIISVK